MKINDISIPNNIRKRPSYLDKESLTVQKEGSRKVKRKVLSYNLDLIISVGYRVESKLGTFPKSAIT